MVCTDDFGLEGILLEEKTYEVLPTAARGVVYVLSEVGWIYCAKSRFE